MRTAPIPDISDEVGRLYTMASDLRPLHPSMPRVIGTALTIKAPPGDNWAIHGACELVQPGSVMVIDWRRTPEVSAGGIASLELAIKRGLAGVVADGGWRDSEETIEKFNFPIIALGKTPYSSPKVLTGEINVPVAVGGVVVHPGDLIVGDGDGVVVVPRDYVAVVVERVRIRHAREAKIGEVEDVTSLASTYWAQFEKWGGVRHDR